MTGCLEAIGLYPNEDVRTHDAWHPEMLRTDVAIRASLCAICILGSVGLLLMGLGFNQSVHPMAGVVVLCSTLIPISIICSLRSSADEAYLEIYN